MHFSEPMTDFRVRLYTDDDRQSVEVEFSIHHSAWHMKVEHGMSRATLGDLVSYLHDQFYQGEQNLLDDWLQIVDSVNLERSNVLTLKTVDRLVGRGAEQASPEELEGMPRRPQAAAPRPRAGKSA
jgi:hypothetical protein